MNTETNRSVKVTVVITTYNLEKFIGRVLDQLEKQTFQNFDVVIVDDCSNDGTIEILESYQEKNKSRYKCIYSKKNNGSPSRVRNIALKSGQIDGKYVVFLDGDDYLENNYLEELYNSIQKNNSQISVCAYDRIDFNSQKIICEEMRNFPESINIKENGKLIPFVNTSLWNKMFLTKLVIGEEMPDFNVGEDLCFLYKAYSKCSLISFVDKKLIHYQVHGNSVISNTSKETIIKFADELEDQLNVSSSDFSNILCLTIFIHIGISMMIRAFQNPNIDKKDHIRWTKEYLLNNDIFNKKTLSITNLCKYGIRGMAIYVCKICYLLNLTNMFFSAYCFFTKISKSDVKF